MSECQRTNKKKKISAMAFLAYALKTVGKMLVVTFTKCTAKSSSSLHR